MFETYKSCLGNREQGTVRGEEFIYPFFIEGVRERPIYQEW